MTDFAYGFGGITAFVGLAGCASAVLRSHTGSRLARAEGGGWGGRQRGSRPIAHASGALASIAGRLRQRLARTGALKPLSTGPPGAVSPRRCDGSEPIA